MKLISNKYLTFKKAIRKSIIKIYYLLVGSSSQYGEDLILDKLLKNKKDGFFVDIGAHHPSHFSNTYKFHKRGWVGINIEPDPNLYERFNKARPNDINLNIGVGPINGSMPFYRMSANTLSTFSESSVRWAVQDGHKLLDVINVPVMRLESIFEKYYHYGPIDFMSVDVEGFEMDVFNSNDWKKFRPVFIIAEIYHNENKIMSFLEGVDYKSIFNNGTNCIFQDIKYSKELDR